MRVLYELLNVSWVLTAFGGLTVNIFNLGAARIAKERAARWTHGKTRLLIAEMTLRREGNGCKVQVILCAGGLVSILNPPTPDLLATRIAIAMMATAVSCLLISDSFAERAGRIRLHAMIKEEQGTKTTERIEP